MQKWRWVFLITASIILANLGSSLYVSFENGHWTLGLFNILSPNEVFITLIASIGIIHLILMMAGMSRRGVKKGEAFFLSALVGTFMYMTLFTMAISIAQIGASEDETVYQTLLVTLQYMTFTKAFIIMSVFVAGSAAVIGLNFGSHFVGNTPPSNPHEREQWSIKTVFTRIRSRFGREQGTHHPNELSTVPVRTRT